MSAQLLPAAAAAAATELRDPSDKHSAQSSTSSGYLDPDVPVAMSVSDGRNKEQKTVDGGSMENQSEGAAPL